MVGGSTRTPKIRELLKNHFNGKQLDQTVNVDEVVAKGAAIHAAYKYNSGTTELFDEYMLIDVTPLPLGIKVVGDFMSNIIEKTVPIPVELYREYTTFSNNQTNMSIDI